MVQLMWWKKNTCAFFEQGKASSDSDFLSCGSKPIVVCGSLSPLRGMVSQLENDA